MGKYLKMSGFFVGNVSINADGQICDDKYFRGSTDIAEDYYAPICHAINSHDELVAEVDRLHQVMQRCCDALYIADKFCGNHTADECDDSIAIPIKDALVEVAKELAK